MVATWHPSKGFEPLTTCLFIDASYASAARYPIDNPDIIDISLRIIKRCGMYAKEYVNWSRARTQSHQLLRRSTHSRNIGKMQLHLSTRLLSRTCNMDTV